MLVERFYWDLVRIKKITVMFKLKLKLLKRETQGERFERFFWLFFTTFAGRLLGLLRTSSADHNRKRVVGSLYEFGRYTYMFTL